MEAWLRYLGLIGVSGGFCVGMACTGDLGSSTNGGSTGSDGAGTGASSSVAPASGSGGSGGSGATTGSGGTAPGCDPGDDEDADGDGFTIAQGDCDDCSANVNPNAVELATPLGEGGAAAEPVDEDCDGTPDNTPEPCDAELALDDLDPLNAARAVELCKIASGPGDWGVVSAEWVMVDGSPPPTSGTPSVNFHLGHGILNGFGENVDPRSGAKLLALSSGTARQQRDPDFESPSGYNKEYSGTFPKGFPKIPPACPEVVPGTPYDPTAIQITLRAPSNVHGFSFNVKFNTFDWRDQLCSNFNDYFIALLSPAPPGGIDGHLLFDGDGNPISVNSAFIDVCGCGGGPPCAVGERTFQCSLGTSELLGTGFEGQAATGWLITTVPVEPNQEFTIRWGAYDSGDYDLDSTGLVDNWRWITEPGVILSTQVDSLLE